MRICNPDVCMDAVDHMGQSESAQNFFYEKPKVMLEVAMKGILNSPGCMYC